MPSDIRRAVLYQAFELLYGPLVLLHEPLGRLFHGPAWRGRRLALAAEALKSDRVIDVGAGEGRLVRALLQRGILCTGFEPSPAMRRRAWSHSSPLVDAPAQSLPLPGGRVDLILVSYPGPWIYDPATWDEFARVLRAGGRVRVLAGGRHVRRSGFSLRALLLDAIYGRPASPPGNWPAAAAAGFRGGWIWQEDRWGEALVWAGELSERDRSVVD